MSTTPAHALLIGTADERAASMVVLAKMIKEDREVACEHAMNLARAHARANPVSTLVFDGAPLGLMYFRSSTLETCPPMSETVYEPCEPHAGVVCHPANGSITCAFHVTLRAKEAILFEKQVSLTWHSSSEFDDDKSFDAELVDGATSYTVSMLLDKTRSVACVTHVTKCYQHARSDSEHEDMYDNADASDEDASEPDAKARDHAVASSSSDEKASSSDDDDEEASSADDE